MISLTFHDLSREQAALLLDAAATYSIPEHVTMDNRDVDVRVAADPPPTLSGSPIPVSLEAVKTLGRELSTKHPKKGGAVREVLNTFGVKSVNDLTPEQRAQFASVVTDTLTQLGEG